MTEQPKDQPIHPDTRCCANCLYYQGGQCRRYPPQMVVIWPRPFEEFNPLETSSPHVDLLFWCGEFQKSEGYSFSHEIAERAADREAQIQTLMTHGKTREQAEAWAMPTIRKMP